MDVANSLVGELTKKRIDMSCEGVQSAINKLRSCGYASPDAWIGCSAPEIEHLETHFSVQLPKCYKEFLSHLGQDPGGFMRGTEYMYDELFGFRPDADNLITESGSTYKLPATAFVFMFHGGYNFAYFLCDGRADPPVLRYEECDEAPHQVADTFSEALNNLVDGFIDLKLQTDGP